MVNKRFALIAGAALLVACSDNTVDPMGQPNFSKGDAGAPAGLGDCATPALKDAQKGRITPGSCNSNDALGRRSQYYTANTAAAGQQLTVQLTSEFAPVLGIKPDTGTVFGLSHAGFLWGSGAVASFSFIGVSPTQQVFVTNRFANETGAYTLTSKHEPITYSCGTPTIYEVGVSFSQTIDAAHACHGTILFSPFPDALGKPLWYQMYYGKLTNGRYEIKLGGITPSFNPVVTVYRNGVYSPARQNVGPAAPDGTRTVIINTVNDAATYGIEISTSGAGTPTPAQPQAGTFTLSIRKL